MSPFLSTPDFTSDEPVEGMALARRRSEQFALHDMWLCPVTASSWVVRELNPVAGNRTKLASIDERNGRFDMTSLTGNGDWDRFDSLDEAVAKLVTQRATVSGSAAGI